MNQHGDRWPVMGTQSIHGPLRSVLRLLEVQSLRGASDQELLHRFATANDESSFCVIIERHGPMVLGVCTRALKCPHDADDAFQATFLVFSQRAASIRKSASLASWLHGVARRVVAKLQREARRRRARERAVDRTAIDSSPDELTWSEVKTGLDEELERLPASYRDVLVLCYLEGQTRDEAARQLGVEVGVVKGRLERARKMLAQRLTRRGLTLSAGLFAIAVSPGTLSATMRAASLLAASQSVSGVVSPGVLSLTNQVLKGIVMSKVKLVGATLLCSLALVAGVGFSTAQAPGSSPQPDNTDSPLQPEQPKPAELTREVIHVYGYVRNPETDEAFIRRLSLDLREVEPTPTEIHFFVQSKEANKRKILVELFVKERTEKEKKAEADARKDAAIQQHLLADLRAALALAQQEAVRREAQRALLPQQQQMPRDLEVLKIKVERAKLNVKQQHILLEAELEKNKRLKAAGQPTDDRQVQLLQIEVQRAELELREAEITLEAAAKAAEKTPPATGTPMK
jgi:RNA polymerase sigma factor (sigma-70 family)